MTKRPYGVGTTFQHTYADGRTVWIAEKSTTVAGKRTYTRGEGPTQEVAWQRLGANLSASKTRTHTGTPKPATKPLEGNLVAPRGTPRSTPTGRWTVEAYATRWNATRPGISETVRHKERRILETHVYPVIGAIRLDQLSSRTRNQVEIFFETLKTTLRNQPSAQVNVYKTLTTFFRHTTKLGLTKTNPMNCVEAVKIARTSKTAEMTRRLKRTKMLLHWITPSADPQIYARVRISLLGLRPSEALGLTWDKIDFDTNHLVKNRQPVIHVEQQLARYEATEKGTGLYIKPHTKTRTNRDVPLDGEALEAIKAWKTLQSKLKKSDTWQERPGLENLVFTTNTGGPIDQNTDQANWQALLEASQAKTPDKEIWSIGYNRKIATTLMLDAGESQAIITGIMGHTATVENEHYYRPQPEAQRTALGSIDRLLPGKLTQK